MVLVEKLDEFGRPAWLALMILGFIAWWPAGLAILGFLGFSGRLRGWRREMRGCWHNAPPRGRRGRPSSGNAAFDDYREETLRRLEDEQKEFMAYLERLRRAKDKAEFDGFMDERRRGGGIVDQPGA